MVRGLRNTFISACLLALSCAAAAAAKQEASLRCYRTDDAVQCFIDAAKTKLSRVTKAEDRAEAIGEMLYTLAATGGRDDALAKEAGELAAAASVRPVKQMDLLYALDIYEPSDQTYSNALRRFAALEQELKGDALVELYADACSIIAWDGAFAERWLDFAHSVCTPEKLQSGRPRSVAYQALVLAMMPVAMTLSEDREGFIDSADNALSWLHAAEQAAAKSKRGADRDFVGSIGVLMHMMNSLCLDAFDDPDAADDEIDVALKSLHRMEMRVGISGRSTSLRRQVVEALFDTGREVEAKKMLRQMLVRVDADRAGRTIALPEQVAILLQAAKLEHDEQADRLQTCVPEGAVEI
jgi:hypothetical protein